MICTSCKLKEGRSLTECKVQKMDSQKVLDIYYLPENHEIVQLAAKLVDGGRTGKLSHLDEILEFIRLMNYNTVALAYYYSMEIEASKLTQILRSVDNVKILYVSCTTGSMAQNGVNTDSCIHKVSCNPIAQAMQLNKYGAEFVLTMGLYLGHDIIFSKYIESDATNFVVKDRLNKNNSIVELENKLKNI
jgi:uncharacterized metal-binding protein